MKYGSDSKQSVLLHPVFLFCSAFEKLRMGKIVFSKTEKLNQFQTD